MPDKFLEWGLEKNHFKIIPPAQIVSEVSTITLATISLWSNEYLEYVGWLNNPIIDILYSMTSAGVWISRVNTSGQVSDANTANISSYTGNTARSNLGGSVGDSANFTTVNLGYAARRIGMLAMTTDGAGAMAATAIATGPTGYYPVVKLLGVWSPTIEASTEFAFTVSAGALVGPTQINLALTAYGVTTIAPYGCPVYLWDTTDASTINIAIANGNATTTHYLIYEYWFET